MKQMKKFSALATGSMAFALLLGTSLAQAEEVCLDGDDIAIGIRGLDVITEQYGQIPVDVDFIYTTGFEIYGSNLDNLPFGAATGEDDSYSVMTSINQTLTAINPVPDFVGRSGSNAYNIGVEEEEGAGKGALATWMGANNTGEKWAPCEREFTDGCVAIGAAIVPAADLVVYAHLTKANGNGCGNAPPNEFPITPGISGSWYDSTRNGEGFVFEVVGSELDPDFLVYFYTYDNSENLMWVSGVGEIEGSTSIVEMFITSGTGFGDNFNPDDVVTKGWGTMTFTFSACREGTAEYVSDDFGSGSYNIERITSISGLSCP